MPRNKTIVMTMKLTACPTLSEPNTVLTIDILYLWTVVCLWISIFLVENIFHCNFLSANMANNKNSDSALNHQTVNHSLNVKGWFKSYTPGAVFLASSLYWPLKRRPRNYRLFHQIPQISFLNPDITKYLSFSDKYSLQC